MSTMTDPTPAMVSMEQALRAGGMRLEPSHLDTNLGTFLDLANGKRRFSCAYRHGDTITAFATLIIVDQIDGLPVFHAGFAVPPPYRGQGRAKAVLKAAIAELAAGLGRASKSAFYIEAVVGVGNAASNAVCRSVLTEKPEEITDSVSGQPALHYIRRVETVRA
jgi:GNAT superfamily N-acetyltransferase